MARCGIMLHFNIIYFNLFVVLFSDVISTPIVLRESTPNGESVVAISSSDPNIEKYLSLHYPTRSGFKSDNKDDKDVVQRSFSIAAPGKAIAGSARSYAAASTDPFQPILPLHIFEGYGFNDFYLKNWLKSVESFYHPSFAGNSGANSVTAINDNGHVYGKVGSVTFDNRAKTPKSNN